MLLWERISFPTSKLYTIQRGDCRMVLFASIFNNNKSHFAVTSRIASSSYNNVKQNCLDIRLSVMNQGWISIFSNLCLDLHHLYICLLHQEGYQHIALVSMVTVTAVFLNVLYSFFENFLFLLCLFVFWEKKHFLFF